MSAGASQRAPRSTADGATARYRAGCDRTVEAAPRTAAGEPVAEFAYTELAFPECPACPHRVEPVSAVPFCVWRRADAPHPFAALGGLIDAVQAGIGEDGAGEAGVREDAVVEEGTAATDPGEETA